MSKETDLHEWVSCDMDFPPLDNSGISDILELRLEFDYKSIHQTYFAAGVFTDDGDWIIPEFPRYDQTRELRVTAWRKLP